MAKQNTIMVEKPTIIVDSTTNCLERPEKGSFPYVHNFRIFGENFDPGKSATITFSIEGKSPKYERIKIGPPKVLDSRRIELKVEVGSGVPTGNWNVKVSQDTRHYGERPDAFRVSDDCG